MPQEQVRGGGLEHPAPHLRRHRLRLHRVVPLLHTLGPALLPPPLQVRGDIQVGLIQAGALKPSSYSLNTLLNTSAICR